MKGKNSLLIASVVYLILGLILLFFPGLTTSLFCTAVGALLLLYGCLLYTSPSPRDFASSRMPSSA